VERSPHILFISAFETSFIRADLAFLESRTSVTNGIGSGFLHLIGLLLDTARTDIVFSWFASVYGAVAVLWGRLLGKRTVMQVGGVDMAKDDVAGYGTWTSWWRSLIVGMALRNADHVLVVDESLGKEAMERAGYDGHNIEVLETRFSPEEWYPEGDKEACVLTVAVVPDMARVYVKGIDLLIEAARMSPGIRFECVGVHETIAKRLDPPANLAIHPPRPKGEVLALMQRAKVYCQPSRREGLSNALCEAMLCGCIPVATDVGGSRRAVGETGFVAASVTGSAIADAVAQAMLNERSLGLEARERIKTEFPESRRSIRLSEILEGGTKRDQRGEK